MQYYLMHTKYRRERSAIKLLFNDENFLIYMYGTGFFRAGTHPFSLSTEFKWMNTCPLKSMCIHCRENNAHFHIMLSIIIIINIVTRTEQMNVSSQLLTLTFECQCNNGDSLPKSEHQHHQYAYCWDLNVNNKHYHNLWSWSSHKMYNWFVIDMRVKAEGKHFIAKYAWFASCSFPLTNWSR
jgi:hypothetical protein